MAGASPAQDDIGPAIGTPRWRVYAQAREVAALAQVAMECAVAGAHENLPRAVAQLDRIRWILGSPPEAEVRGGTNAGFAVMPPAAGGES